MIDTHCDDGLFISYLLLSYQKKNLDFEFQFRIHRHLLMFFVSVEEIDEDQIEEYTQIVDVMTEHNIIVDPEYIVF